MSAHDRASLGRAVAEARQLLTSALSDDLDLDVRVGPPRSGEEPAGVDLSYLSTTGSGATAGANEHRLSVELALLASVHAEPERAIDAIDAIWVATDGSSVRIEPVGVDGAWWSAHGLAPRPSVGIALAAVIERAAPEVPLVTVGVEVDGGARAVSWLTGIVSGPDGSPLVGAGVAPIGSASLATRTDVRGRFAIAALFPSATVPVEITLGRYGRSLELRIEEDNQIELDDLPAPPLERTRG